MKDSIHDPAGLASGIGGSNEKRGWHARRPRPRPRLTRRQKRAAALDWTYFEVELYAHLAEHAPDMLVGPWRLLDELIRLEERYWFCNSSTPGELGDGAAQENCSHLDLDALHADWHALKERVWVVS